jgi:hypothetical protein
MKIFIQRSGGYAGISETLHDVDTADLDPASATELEKLALGAEAAAKSAAAAQPVGADFLKYEVTLSDDHGSRSWTIVDDDSPALGPLRRLLQSLAARGR